MPASRPATAFGPQVAGAAHGVPIRVPPTPQPGPASRQQAANPAHPAAALAHQTGTTQAAAPQPRSPATPASPQRAQPTTFADIAGLWDATQVMRLAAAGVVTGDPAGRFAPAQPLTRAALAVMLQRSFAPDPAGTGSPAFSDVPAGNWAAAGIAVVAGAGWMDGTGGRFRPEQAVTRAEAVTAVVRALRLPTAAVRAPAFADAAAIPAWAAPSVAAAVSTGIVTGFPNGTFRPDAPLTRAGAAELLAVAYARVRPLPPPPPPAAPDGLYLTSANGYAGLAWSAVPGATGYLIDRMAPGGSWTAVGHSTGTSWPDYGADATIAYAYRVRALGDGGQVSPPSAAVSEPAISPLEVASLGAWHLPVSTLVLLQDVSHSPPGTPFELDDLNYGGLPALPHTTENPGGTTLVLSDDGETFYRPTLLCQATAAGAVRVFYDHINGSGAPARVSVVLYNFEAATVAYAVASRIVDTSGGPKAQGEAVSAVMLGSAWPGTRGSLKPGQGVVLDPAAGYVAAGGAVLGDYELSLSGPLHIAITAVRAGQDPLAEYVAHRLPATAGGPGAGRGTFASATRILNLSPSASEPQMLRLADGHEDPYLSGFDELTGATVYDNGNYGVIYRIRGTPSVPTVLVAVPVGGGYYGALDSGGQVVPAPSHVIPADAGIAFLVATWLPDRSNEVDWTPPGGSYLPLELITVPLG